MNMLDHLRNQFHEMHGNGQLNQSGFQGVDGKIKLKSGDEIVTRD